MSAKDERPPEQDSDPDDLVENARELEERAHELEAEEAELEEREQAPRKWLEHEPKHYWPPLENDEDDDDA